MRRDDLIDKILSNEDEPAPDHSLRGRSLRHTEEDYVPKTLTPYEWLEYYEQHGIPESHISFKKHQAKPISLWQKLMAWLTKETK